MEKSTSHIKNINGIPIRIPNKIIKESKKYYISYNNKDISIYGSSTTALYINETSQFLILNGNHVNNYDKLKSLEECLAYFYNNIKKANFRSEHGAVFKFENDKGVYKKGGY